MHAVLLAAGVGRRLTDITGGGPKSLLPFGELSLLERHVRQLAAAGIHRLTIVVGCEAMQIEQALAAIVSDAAPEMTVTTEHNARFREGSALSVLTAREALTSGDDVLLMDADVLYDQRMLACLLASESADALLIDRNVDADDAEPVKICLADGRIVAFDKQLPAELSYDVIGESVGFFRLSSATAASLIEACEQVSEADAESPYEAGLQYVMRARGSRFAAEDVTGLPWIEIDYPEDVDRAMDQVLPQLESLHDG